MELERHLVLLHEANAGFDHVTGDIAGVAASVTDRTVWIPNVQALSRSHAVDNVIRWDDLHDVSRFPMHVRVFEAGEEPAADKQLTVPYGSTLERARQMVAEAAAAAGCIALRLSFVEGAAPAAFPRHPSAAVRRLADAAARRLGRFDMLHMRMTDKVGHRDYDPRCFRDEAVVAALAPVLPGGGRLYVMTNHPDPRRAFPLLCGAYEVLTCDDVPELRGLRRKNYLLYQVEKSLLERAGTAVANIKRLVPGQIGLWKLIAGGYVPHECEFEASGETGRAEAAGAAGVSDGRVQPRPRVAVLGLYRGGTSAVAGLLHHLGLDMGAPFNPADSFNPRGYYEPPDLSAELRRACDEPSLRRLLPASERVGLLRRWLASRAQTAGGVGAKHPLLCLMGDEVLEAWGPRARLVAVYRPLEQCIASLQRTGWWPSETCREVQAALWDAREAFLARADHLRVDFRELLADPRKQAERIATYIGVEPTGERAAAAAGFIDPSLASPGGADPDAPPQPAAGAETPTRARRVRLVIAVASARKYRERRTRCRRLWAHALSGAPGVVWRFFVGAGCGEFADDAEPDTIVVDGGDDYSSLPRKTEAAIRWFLERYDFEYLFKCDDDTYVQVDRLLAYSPPHEYCGWSISKSFPGGPDYASGGAGYFVSRRAAEIAVGFLARHPTGAEDALLGDGLAAAGIRLHHDESFGWNCQEGATPAPSNRVMTAHWVNSAESEAVVRRPWASKAVAAASPDDLVVKVGSRVIRWVIGPRHDREFTRRVLLPWACPGARALGPDARADFTVGAYLTPNEVSRVMGSPGVRFVVCGEAGQRAGHGEGCYQFVSQPTEGDDEWTRYGPMLCLWAPPIDAPAKDRPCSVIEGRGREHRVRLFDRLRETVGDVDAYGPHYGRPLGGFHCVGPDASVFSKYEGLARYGFSGSVERVVAEDYVTEKFFDPILCEAVPLYQGCPNIADYAVPGSYVPIEDAGQLDWAGWEQEYGKRRPAVLRQKALIRTHFNVLSYFVQLTARLEMLDRIRPITLSAIGAA